MQLTKFERKKWKITSSLLLCGGDVPAGGNGEGREPEHELRREVGTSRKALALLKQEMIDQSILFSWSMWKRIEVCSP